MTCQQHWSWFQAELERIEAERLAKEEEEERLAMEEAERLGAEARRAEEERLQKAIEEAQKREVRPVKITFYGNHPQYILISAITLLIENHFIENYFFENYFIAPR